MAKFNNIYYKDSIDDPYSFMIESTTGAQPLTASERFELVSSLYGPGNVICWFFLLASVLTSWTINPTTARRDTITNDFIAVLTMPFVAVAHFFHQIHHHQSDTNGSLGQLLNSRDRDDVRSVAALEAPLTVCEDFLAWAAVIFAVSARREHQKRTATVLTVGWLCVVAGMILMLAGPSYGSTPLVRPFVSQSTAIFGIFLGWHLLILVVYLVEVVFGLFLTLVRPGAREVESAVETPSLARRILWPGRVSSWMSAFSSVVIGAFSIWIKYGLMYPPEWRFHSFRFIPKSNANLFDLDQVVAMLGGLVTLSFSLRDAYKQRKARGARRRARN